VLSGRGLCDELITRPEESYRLWCVVVCDLENLVNEEAMTRVGSQGHRIYIYIYIYIYIGFKTFFYVVRHLDSIASYLPTDLHLGFFLSWPSLYLPSSFSLIFLVLSIVSASTSMLFWVIFLLPFSEHGRTM